MESGRRITLVTRPSNRHAERAWDFDSDAHSRVIVVGSFTVLRYALEQSMSEMAHDVERLVVDRTATAAQFLELLASLPDEFGGDVLYIRDDEGGFLSAAGRGAGRMIYALSQHDLHFYLATHALVVPPLPMRQTA
jgi:hypothetical protein